jgi:hypothetical protein
MHKFSKLYAKVALTSVLLCFFSMFFYHNAKADVVDNRSLGLGSVVASATTHHAIKFNFITTNSVGSIKFEYCTSPLQVLPCVPPAGLNASAATLSSQSGETGFIIFSQNANTVILGRAPAVTGAQANSYTLDNVVNPSSLGSFYLRISSYASSDGTGSALDFGGTVGVITQGVTITTEVPPILEFCVGVTIPSLCPSASGNFLDLGDFRPNSTAAGTSQFMVGTNAAFGYIVTANGNTMTSGNNTIPALVAPAASHAGQSQFGINLRANTNPAVGTDPNGGSGNPTPDYNSINQFKFVNGDTIASHTFVSDLERYTVSYIVNVDSNRPIGVYNTTLTYVVTATF